MAFLRFVGPFRKELKQNFHLFRSRRSKRRVLGEPSRKDRAERRQEWFPSVSSEREGGKHNGAPGRAMHVLAQRASQCNVLLYSRGYRDASVQPSWSDTFSSPVLHSSMQQIRCGEPCRDGEIQRYVVKSALHPAQWISPSEAGFHFPHGGVTHQMRQERARGTPCPDGEMRVTVLRPPAGTSREEHAVHFFLSVDQQGVGKPSASVARQQQQQQKWQWEGALAAAVLLLA